MLTQEAKHFSEPMELYCSNCNKTLRCYRLGDSGLADLKREWFCDCRTMPHLDFRPHYTIEVRTDALFEWLDKAVRDLARDYDVQINTSVKEGRCYYLSISGDNCLHLLAEFKRNF